MRLHYSSYPHITACNQFKSKVTSLMYQSSHRCDSCSCLVIAVSTWCEDSCNNFCVSSSILPLDLKVNKMRRWQDSSAQRLFLYNHTGRFPSAYLLLKLNRLVKQRTFLGNLWRASLCGVLLKKSISCTDCVGISSAVWVSFIEFCLASFNDEVVNIPIIFLALFSSALVCVRACTVLEICVGKAAHVLSMWLFLSVWVCLGFQLCVFLSVSRQCVCVKVWQIHVCPCCCSFCLYLCKAFWAAYVLKPLAALIHPVLS